MAIGDKTAGALIGLGAQGIGMIGEGARYRRNLRGQKELMDIQNINQRGLNIQGHDLQYDMWKKTNYPAQVAMLKEAGLNPALIYGSAGAGGSTGSQGGGSAAGGSAPNQYQPMDMSNMLMGAQAAKILAETKQIKENTNESKERQNKLVQEVENLIESKKLTEAQKEYAQSQKAREDLETDIRKLDKEFFKEYNISNAEYGWIESLRIGGWKLADILQTFYDWNWKNEDIDPDEKSLINKIRDKN